jgi:hypothetical protein
MNHAVANPYVVRFWLSGRDSCASPLEVVCRLRARFEAGHLGGHSRAELCRVDCGGSITMTAHGMRLCRTMACVDEMTEGDLVGGGDEAARA